MGAKRGLALSAVVFLCLLASACGGNGKGIMRKLSGSGLIGPENPTYKVRFHPQPAKVVALSDVLAEVDALSVPDGVEPSLFEDIKGELIRQLQSRFIEKVVSAPPSGEGNEVSDLVVTDNGDGTVSLEWSYYNLGDYNQDSIADVADIATLAEHFFHAFNGGAWNDSDDEVIDGNRDGIVDVADVSVLAEHFFQEVAGYVIEGAETEDGPFTEIMRVDFDDSIKGSRRKFIVPRVNVGGLIIFRVVPFDRSLIPGLPGRPRGRGPTAQANAERVDGLTFKFYGVGSTPRGGNVAFAWDFNSDGIFETLPASIGITPDASAGEQSPTYTYPSEGTYTATLRVYDDRGNFSEAKVVVGAYLNPPTNSAPSVSALVGDLTGQSPLTVRFLGFADDADGKTSPLTYEWNFGDGSPISNEIFPVHTYTTSGLYRVRLKVTDDEGVSSVAQLTLAVCYSGPIPDMSPSALSFVMGDFQSTELTFTFGALGADMDGGAVSFEWNFGYGSAGDTVRDPTHTFPQAGNYFVTMTTKDDEENESSAGMTIFAGTPVAESYPPAVWMAGYMLTGSQNYRQQFMAEAFDPDGGDVAFSWDFDGDGVFGDFGETARDPIVTYTVPGTYEVWVEATDDEGDKSYAFLSFVIHTCGIPGDIPPPPENHVVDGGGGGGDGRIGINPKCYPKPLVIFHGQTGTLYLIYNGPVDAGDPRIGRITIQSFGQIINPLPVDIDNTGNGAGGGDIIEPDPLAPAPPSPPLRAGQSWSAFSVSRPHDPPKRIEHLGIQFKLRDDGRAAATKTCDVYVIHLVSRIINPPDGGTVDGPVDITVRIDPAGIDQTFGFPGIDPGELIRVYLTIDGVIVGEMTRTPDSNEWAFEWNSGSVPNGLHTIDYHVYDARGPQPGEPNDPGPIEEGQISVTVDNPPPPEIASIDLWIDPVPPIDAGAPFTFHAVTKDPAGHTTFDPFLDVFIEISPARSNTGSQVPGDTDRAIFQMINNGDGTYSLPFFIEPAGLWKATVIVRDNRVADKVANLIDIELIEVFSLLLSSIDSHYLSSPFGPIMFYGRDGLGNTAHAEPGDFSVLSDNPAIVPGEVMYSETSSDIFLVPFTATNYATANLTVQHTGSGASEEFFVGYPPWNLTFWPGVGVPADGDFYVYIHARVPPELMQGWIGGDATIFWPDIFPNIYFVNAFPAMANVDVSYEGPFYNPETSSWTLYVSWTSTSPIAITGETTPVSLQFQAPVVDLPLSSSFTIVDYNLITPAGGRIPYDPSMFRPPSSPYDFYNFPFVVKPTKTLNMHVYVVMDTAMQEEIETDIGEAEDMFNLNAAHCTFGFYVDFVPTFTEIPVSDWLVIDEDDDGLDRFDANGDGDYADPGDNNDLFNAMSLGYYDSTPSTENIYYVPYMRGLLSGATYWPNRQIAIDNFRDLDNLTLAHEKVHEMDLRKDGDFDVLDGADMNHIAPGIQMDPDAEAQGAYQAGNIMNYASTGRSLTEDQAKHLDP